MTLNGARIPGTPTEIFEELQNLNYGAEFVLGYQIGTRDGLPLFINIFENGPQVYELVDGKPVFKPGTITFPHAAVWEFTYLGNVINGEQVYDGYPGDTLVITQTDPTTPPVPEPSSLLLIGTGLATAIGMRRRLTAN